MCSVLTPPSDTPTLAQINELGSLVRDIPPPLPNIPHLLEPLANALSRKWCRNFVFARAPLHVQHLMSPVLAMNSLTCEISKTCISPNAPPSATPVLPGEGFHQGGYGLFVPTFTADHLTVGVGVYHSSYCDIFPGLGAKSPSCISGVNMRFVLDAKRQILSVVMGLTDNNIFYVTTAHLQSTTSCIMFSGVLDKGFQDIALAKDGDELSSLDIIPSIYSAQEEYHSFACTVCSAAPQVLCECQLTLATPEHPFDMGYFIKQMSFHLGISTALATKHNILDSQVDPQTMFGARLTMHGIVDAAITQKLSTWSIVQYANGVKISPLSLGVSTGTTTADHQDNPGAFDENYDATALAGSDTLQGDDTEILPVMQHSSLIPLPLPPSEQGFAGSLEDTVRHSTDPNIPLIPLSAPTFPLLNTHSVPLQNSPAVAQQEQFLHGDSAGLSTQEDDQGKSLRIMSLGEEIDSLANLESAPYALNELQREDDIVQSGSGSPNARDLMKNIREQERRERNRESARRSNLRQKILRNHLREQIRSEEHKVISLREREISLRNENITLRKRVAEKKKRGDLVN